MTVRSQFVPTRTYSARRTTDGAFHVEDFTCYLHSAMYCSESEAEIMLPRHTLIYMLDGDFDSTAEHSWDGRLEKHEMFGIDYSLLIPAGRHFASKTRGCAATRYIVCEIAESALPRVLGGQVGDIDLRPFFGSRLMAPGMAERLESLCKKPGNFPLVYAEAVASTFIVEMFRAYTPNPNLPDLANVASARFKVVLDYIEEHLDSGVGLFQLASLLDLSVTQFSHAFKTEYGITPSHYIRQRRAERANVRRQSGE